MATAAGGRALRFTPQVSDREQLVNWHDHCSIQIIENLAGSGTTMSMLFRTLFAAWLIAGATAAVAHHAFAAEFDADRPIDLQGTVTKVKWVNPHSWLYFEVKEKDGSLTQWGVEFGTPNALA